MNECEDQRLQVYVWNAVLYAAKTITLEKQGENEQEEEERKILRTTITYIFRIKIMILKILFMTKKCR